MNIYFLSILHFFNDGFQAGLILLLPFIAKDIGLTLTQIGILGSSINIVGILVSLPSSHIAEKFGPLKTLKIIILFFLFSYLGVSLSKTFPSFIIFYLMAGIAFGVFHPISMALLTKWTNRKKLGFAMGNFGSFGDIGRIILSTFLTFIVSFIGWRLTSSLYSFFALLIFISYLLFKTKKQSDPNLINKTIKISLIKILKNSKFILALLVNFFDNFSSSSLFLFLPFLLLSKGVGNSTLGLFTGAYLVGNFIGKSSLGKISDLLKNTTVFIIAEIFMSIAIILLANYATTTPILIGLSTLLGILTQGTIPVRSTMIVEANEHHGNFEKAFSVSTLVSSISNVLAPATLGFIADHFGIVNTFNTAAIIALIAIIPAFLFHLSLPTKH